MAGTHVKAVEGDHPVLMALRLKVVGRKITEVETTVVRNRTEGMIFQPDAVKTASAAMNVTPPQAGRNKREDLERIALLYPAGLKTGSFVKTDTPFNPEAYRFENGQLMAGPGCSFFAGCDRIKEQRALTSLLFTGMLRPEDLNRLSWLKTVKR